MSKSLSSTLLGIGALLIVVGLLNHFALHMNAIPHTSSILAVLAVIILAVGGYGFATAKN